MTDNFNKDTEDKLLKKVTPYLHKGRPGDYEHTLRAVDYGKQILEKEDGIPGIVIPTLYLHDIGWSLVDYADFIEAPSPDKKYYSYCVGGHMKQGATQAKTILEELEYGSETIQKIIAIIAVHDDQQAVLALNDPSATIVHDADQLDKVGPEAHKRFEKIFADAKSDMDMEKTRYYMEKGAQNWFQTETAKAMARALLEESPIENIFNEL